MTTISATPERLQNLREWNLALTALHLVQAIVIILIAGNFVINVTSTFPEGPPGTRVPLAEPLFGVRVGVVIGLFLLLAAVDHFVTVRKRLQNTCPSHRSDLRSCRRSRLSMHEQVAYRLLIGLGLILQSTGLTIESSEPFKVLNLNARFGH